MNDATPRREDRSGGRQPRAARAMYFVAPGVVEVRAEPVAAPGRGECEVQAEVMGVSGGTELLLYRGQLPGDDMVADAKLPALQGTLRYPLRYGYSCVGNVMAGALRGKRVFVFYPHQDRFVVGCGDCLVLPDNVSSTDAACLPSVETAVTVVHDLALRLGETALVVGQGVIGLLVAQLLRRAGHTVVAVEPRSDRRQRAAELDCVALAPGPEAADQVRGLTGGRGVDGAVDASGTAAGLQLAIDALAFSGTLVAAAWHGGRPTELQLGGHFHRNRARIKASQVSTIDPEIGGRWDRLRRTELVLSLLGELRPGRLVTHRVPLAAAADAYAMLDSGGDGVLQVLLEP